MPVTVNRFTEKLLGILSATSAGPTLATKIWGFRRGEVPFALIIPRSEFCSPGSTGGAVDHLVVNLTKLTLPRFTNGDRDGRMEVLLAVFSPRLLAASDRTVPHVGDA